MQLTQKEKILLEDQKKHEEMCIKKYREASQKANDPQLKQLFSTFAEQEQQHYQTVEQIINGQVPAMQQGSQSGSQSSQASSKMGKQQRFQGEQQAGLNMSSPTTGLASQEDADLCNDLLMTEKYVSGAYDTTIFECTDSHVRQTLNHIQKEEQQHGEGIFNYMQQNGMYQPS
ncbi:MAG: spore coat protein [Firmicutes bacterium]|nr:spore coat protein [Bacillota bacterium]